MASAITVHEADTVVGGGGDVVHSESFGDLKLAGPLSLHVCFASSRSAQLGDHLYFSGFWDPLWDTLGDNRLKVELNKDELVW